MSIVVDKQTLPNFLIREYKKGTNINMKNINPYILLCISILITLLYGLLRNVYSKLNRE